MANVTFAATTQSRGYSQAFPLLLLPILLYGIVYLICWGIYGSGFFTNEYQLPGSGNVLRGMDWFLETQGFTIPMFSGDAWFVNIGDMFLFVSIVLLFVEIVKAGNISPTTLINHALSMLVFVIGLVLFITTIGFSNSVFGLILMMLLVDVIAGNVITNMAARRDLAIG